MFTIYFKKSFDVNSIDVWMLQDLFGIETAIGSNFINCYTLDASIVDSVADEIGRDKIEEIAKPS